ncbi:hypothetical protein ACFP1Z_12420 [Streptomyces gamaensis]|uniref:Uncharacterized protein n=1 Tax=Streptomyces gamaensis TaxID=1763542 RepID=A0ABW0YXP8_9ACTN
MMFGGSIGAAVLGVGVAHAASNETVEHRSAKQAVEPLTTHGEDPSAAGQQSAGTPAHRQSSTPPAASKQTASSSESSAPAQHNAPRAEQLVDTRGRHAGTALRSDTTHSRSTHSTQGRPTVQQPPEGNASGAGIRPDTEPRQPVRAQPTAEDLRSVPRLDRDEKVRPTPLHRTHRALEAARAQSERANEPSDYGFKKFSERLPKDFGDDLRALQDVDLHVHRVAEPEALAKELARDLDRAPITAPKAAQSATQAGTQWYNSTAYLAAERDRQWRAHVDSVFKEKLYPYLDRALGNALAHDEKALAKSVRATKAEIAGIADQALARAASDYERQRIRLHRARLEEKLDELVRAHSTARKTAYRKQHYDITKRTIRALVEPDEKGTSAHSTFTERFLNEAAYPYLINVHQQFYGKLPARSTSPNWLPRWKAVQSSLRPGNTLQAPQAVPQGDRLSTGRPTGAGPYENTGGVQEQQLNAREFEETSGLIYQALNRGLREPQPTADTAQGNPKAGPDATEWVKQHAQRIGSHGAITRPTAAELPELVAYQWDKADKYLAAEMERQWEDHVKSTAKDEIDRFVEANPSAEFRVDLRTLDQRVKAAKTSIAHVAEHARARSTTWQERDLISDREAAAMQKIDTLARAYTAAYKETRQLRTELYLDELVRASMDSTAFTETFRWRFFVTVGVPYLQDLYHQIHGRGPGWVKTDPVYLRKYGNVLKGLSSQGQAARA